MNPVLSALPSWSASFIRYIRPKNTAPPPSVIAACLPATSRLSPLMYSLSEECMLLGGVLRACRAQLSGQPWYRRARSVKNGGEGVGNCKMTETLEGLSSLGEIATKGGWTRGPSREVFVWVAGKVYRIMNECNRVVALCTWSTKALCDSVRRLHMLPVVTAVLSAVSRVWWLLCELVHILEPMLGSLREGGECVEWGSGASPQIRALDVELDDYMKKKRCRGSNVPDLDSAKSDDDDVGVLTSAATLAASALSIDVHVSPSSVSKDHIDDKDAALSYGSSKKRRRVERMMARDALRLMDEVREEAEDK